MKIIEYIYSFLQTTKQINLKNIFDTTNIYLFHIKMNKTYVNLCERQQFQFF